MSLSTSTITAAIAALSITGVTIRDIDEIPDQVQPRDVPMLYPHPDQFMQGGSGGGEGLSTFGTPMARMWLFNRTFRYVYLHASAGSERGIAPQYTGMSAKVDAILEALITLDVAQVDVRSLSVTGFGIMQDSAGASFFGCLIDITLREKVYP